MYQELQQRFAALKFSPTPDGGMKGKLEDVEVTAIKGPVGEQVIVTFSHPSNGEAARLQLKMAPLANFQEIGRVLSAGCAFIREGTNPPPELVSDNQQRP